MVLYTMNMKINVASTNPIKIAAVQEVIAEYQALKNALVEGVEDIQGVPQPLTLEATTNCARMRAKGAFHECAYSVGIASGFCALPGTDNEYWDVTVCAVYDGVQYHIGLSGGYPVPQKIVTLIREHTITLQQACKMSGLTDKQHLGAQEGCVGVLTSGRITRKSSTMQGLYKAFAFVEHPEWF